MAQSGYTPILTYASGTATNVPLAANLTSSASGAELALNYADGKLYYKNSSGVVTLLASATTVTNSFSAGTTGFTPSTATTGAVTLAGTLITSNGGTGLSSFTAGDLPYYATGTALSKLGIGTTGQILTSSGTAPQWSTLSGVAVTTISFGTTGLTPATATSGAITVAGTLAIANGGTGQTTANAAFNALVPSQTSQTGKFLTTDGTNTSWATNPLGTVTSVAATVPSFLSITGSPITTSGTLAIGLSGTALATTNGGTGLTSFTANGVVYASSTSALATGSTLTFDGANLGVTAGNINLSNAYFLNGRNTANTGFVPIVKVAAGDILEFGSGGYNANFTGNVGIGTSLPSSKLQVVSTGAATIFGSSGASNVYSQWNYNNAAIGYLGNGLAIQSSAAATDFALGATNKLWMVSSSGSQYAVLDSSGNLGLGVTPSAWGGGFKAIQINANGIVYANGTNSAFFGNNYYYDGSVNKYLVSNFASAYGQVSGAHQWFTAPSGTAGNAITFTQAMTLDASGNLLLGATANIGSARIYVLGSVADSVARIYNSSATTPSGVIVVYSGAAPNNTGSEFLYCSDTGALRASIRSNGGIANYAANNVVLSDRREKTNFAPAKSYLETICAIPVQTFNYIDQNMEDDGGLTLGVVAQDVQAVAPELVSENNWGTKDQPKMRLEIYQTDLQYALMKALQELKAEFDAYKATHP